MPNNHMAKMFVLGIEAAISRRNSLKEYLLHDKGLTPEDIEGRIERCKAQYEAYRALQKLPELSQEDRQELLETSGREILTAIETPEADTPVEQKSWWASFRAFLGL